MNYCTLKNIEAANILSKDEIKAKVRSGELRAVKLIWNIREDGEYMYIYLVPVSEVRKLEGFKNITLYYQTYYQPDTIQMKFREELSRLKVIMQDSEGIKKIQSAIKHNTQAVKYFNYMRSAKWQKLRARCFERDGYQCRKCGSAKNLEMHHTAYKHLRQSEEINDAATLCRSCHRKVHEHDFKME